MVSPVISRVYHSGGTIDEDGAELADARDRRQAFIVTVPGDGIEVFIGDVRTAGTGIIVTSATPLHFDHRCDLSISARSLSGSVLYQIVELCF